MNARILIAAALTAVTFGAFPTQAADPQMLTLVMPDAKVIAGVNVEQARSSPLGQLIISQTGAREAQFQEFSSMLGFDPRRDVREILIASDSGPNQPGSKAKQSGLVLARGNFDPAKITAFAQQKGAASTNYGGLTILQDPKQLNGVAFVDNSLAIMGDLANVRAAIDRLSKPSVLPAPLMVQVNEWSLNQDAWMVGLVPPGSFAVPPGAVQLPGLAQQPSLQSIRQAAAGVKFGSTVAFNMKAETDTPENATAFAGAIQLIANVMQMQAAKNPEAADFLKSLSVNTQGNVVALSVSVPQEKIEEIMRRGAANPQRSVAPRARRPAREL